MLLIWIFLALVLIVLLISFICFRMAFWANRNVVRPEYDIPEGEIYEPYREQMVQWMKEVRAMPHEDMTITSFDGLKLRGRYFEFSPDAPIELMFHGYRGNADRDLCGGVQRCFALGHSALIVDQRACGGSQGNVISFGVKEHRDCHSWLAFMQERFGSDAKIILCGISMGASTVVMAAGKPLPENVIGVLADCGFSSAEAIIKKVVREDMKLPAGIAYPFVKLGARLFGGFELDENPAIEAVKRCKVPLILFHGESDDFVPCYMSRELYEACTVRKQLVTIPGAGHGLSYLVDPKKYLQALGDFFPLE